MAIFLLVEDGHCFRVKSLFIGPNERVKAVLIFFNSEKDCENCSVRISHCLLAVWVFVKQKFKV